MKGFHGGRAECQSCALRAPCLVGSRTWAPHQCPGTEQFTSYLMGTHPSELQARTVPAGLDTLSGLLRDLLPIWVLSADPRGTTGTWGTSSAAGMDQSRAHSLQRAFPCPLHTRPPLQVSPSPPAITLLRGSRGRGWGRGPPAWSSACCGLQVPIAGLCWKDIPGALGSAKSQPKTPWAQRGLGTLPTP